MKAYLVIVLYAQLTPLVSHFQYFADRLPAFAFLFRTRWLTELKIEDRLLLVLVDAFEAEDEDIKLEELFAEGD